MSYTQQFVNIGSYGSGNPEHFLEGDGNQAFPSTFRYALLSVWFDQVPQANFSVQIRSFQSFLTEGFNVGFDVGNGQIFVSMGDGAEHSAQPYSGLLEFIVPADFGLARTNILVALDSVGQVVQLYVNDVRIMPSSSDWTAAVPMSSADGIPGLVEGGGGGSPSSCVADLYAGHTASFFDLTVTANRRKFISDTGGPVDLGSAGQLPTGISPEIFLSVYGGSSPSDILVNRGLGGVNFITFATDPLVFCSAPVVPEQPVPQSLHRWRGQVGINWRGLALVGDAYTNLVGLSDFENFTEYGNTMRFLITTPVVDDDRKRIFVPRFEIEVQSGQGLPNNPSVGAQMMLDYSKDGGTTFVGLQKWRSMGAAGEYRQRLRWVGLGQARQWVFRLQCTDPVRRYIIGTFYDSYKGIG